MPFPVKNLIDGVAEPIVVGPDDYTLTALSLMIQHAFSQLPVVDTERHSLGMVTGDSILSALMHLGLTPDSLRVRDAAIKASEFRPDDDLFDLLDDLRDAYAVLVVDGERRVVGIVTSYDTTEYFRRRAEDVMLVEDIETSLREHIRAAFSDTRGDVDQEALESAITRCFNQRIAFDKLGLAQTITLVTHDSQWPRYERNLPLDRDALYKLLNGVRMTRNQLMHFRGDISPVQRSALQYCTQWLAIHQPATRAYQDAPTVGPIENPDEIDTARPSELPEELVPAGEAVSPTDSRYAPLADYLRVVSSEHDRIRLGFVDVEAIIRDELPPSARAHRAWWANETVGQVQSREWLDAGWRVASVDLSEGWVVFARIREREHAYIAFFNSLLTQLRDAAIYTVRVGSHDGAGWHIVGGLPESGTHVGVLVYSFARGDRFRVEFYIDTGNEQRNKSIFDSLHAHKDEIEAALGATASWERLDGRRAKRIALYHEGSITASADQLGELRRWAVPVMIRMHDVLDDALSRRALLESK